MRPIRRPDTGLRALLHDRRGGTAIEYGFIVSLIVIAIFAALGSFAETVLEFWDLVSRVFSESAPKR